jgi:glutamyl-tRNA synthetase
MGTARTALFSYLVARASGGKFILRIDDTDVERNQPEHIQTIIDGMEWLGLEYDVIVRQSERDAVYATALKHLEHSNWTEPLENQAVGFKYKTGILPNKWSDSLSGEIPINYQNIVLKRANGGFLYNFCSIVDDLTLGVNWILRGTDHITNTGAQVVIANALGGLYPHRDIKFTHLGLIYRYEDIYGKMVPKKLSKRTGAKCVLDFKKEGCNRDSFLHCLFKLGWSSKDSKFDSKYKTLTKQNMIDLILDGNFQAKQSMFDVKKLESLNRIYNARSVVREQPTAVGVGAMRVGVDIAS